MEEQNISPTATEAGAATPAAGPTAGEENSAGQTAQATEPASAMNTGTQSQTPQDASAPGQQYAAGEQSQEQPAQTSEPGQSAQFGQQPQQVQQPQQLPPGYAVNPATGQIVFTGPIMQQPAQPGVVYVQQQPTPEQIAAQQTAAAQRYGQVVNSVEQFVNGEATVSDVVKTLYLNTAQDGQLWKGAIVGAAAAVLLTSEPVRDVMGKTFEGLFPGLKQNKQPVEQAKDTIKTSDKEE